MKSVASLARHQEGTTAIEYAFIAGVLSIAVLAGSLLLSEQITLLYEGVGSESEEALRVGAPS